MNEVGLAVAALNFPTYSYYFPPRTPFRHIASYELITKLLSGCGAVSDAEKLLSDAVITDTPFSDEIRPTPLHWIISDKTASIVAEQTEQGLKIYKDPYGVLANSPPFPYQTSRLAELASMSAENPKSPLFSEIEYASNGCGAIGLPGDFSSPSRFLRAAFMVRVGTRGDDEVSDAFHIMDTLSIPRGAVISADGEVHHTVYTACIDTERKTYYFHTNESRGIRAVKMDSQRVCGSCISGIGIRKSEDVAYL
jgi:choloylglycine hydrolase